MDNGSRLVELARKKFEKFSKAEEKLLRKIARGEVADFSSEVKERNDPAGAKKWGKERVLKAEVVAWLCTDAEASELVAHRGIWVKCARIEGGLDLVFARISFGLFFENCAFSEDINLRSSRVCVLSFSGSHTGSIDATNSNVDNGIFLCNGFRANGIVCLDGATIGGSLDCTGGEFINPKQRALEANGVKVSRSVFLHNGFRAEGMVGLVSTSIGGNLECNQGEFINKGKVALNADGLRVRGDVFLCEGFWGKDKEVRAAGFRAEGEVKVAGAEIGGSLECNGGEFINPDGPALHGRGFKVGGSVLLHDGFRAEGTVTLVGATIGGNLECNQGEFINSGKTALDADRIEVKGDVFLCAGSWESKKSVGVKHFIAKGEVKFIGAEIGGSLDCTGGHFLNDIRCAFNAMNSEVNGNVFMRNGFRSVGAVTLVGATIGGNLECNQGVFVNRKGDALDAERLRITGDVFLCEGFWGEGKKIKAEGFRAEGQVKLVRAIITGSLNCRSGKFINPGDSALKVNGLRMGGNLFLCDGFRAEGQVHLVDATIGGDLKCNNGEFINSGQMAINAERLKVKGDVFLCAEDSSDGVKGVDVEHFKSAGEVKLAGTVIDGTLKCRGAFFAGNEANSVGGTVNLSGATIKKQFVWTEIVSPKNVRLDLQSAKVGEFLDDEESWPAKGMLNVAGLVYDSIADMDRRKWLRLQREFQHQPYEQLASILRKHGRDEEARKVLIAKARERAMRKQMSRLEWAYHNLLGLTIGYGYLPWRAFRISVVMVLVGWIIFALGYHRGMIMKTKEMEYVSVHEEKKSEVSQPVRASEDYPKFGALVYSLDVFVPLVDLHQATYWLPNAKFGDKLFKSELLGMSMPTSGDLLRLYMWFHILSGWILTTLLFVGLSGFVKR